MAEAVDQAQVEDLVGVEMREESQKSVDNCVEILRLDHAHVPRVEPNAGARNVELDEPGVLEVVDRSHAFASEQRSQKRVGGTKTLGRCELTLVT